MKITAITPTRDRPEAMGLLEMYMQTQTRKPDEWIVVDDGDVPAIMEFHPDVHFRKIQRTRLPEDGRHTLAANLRQALKNVPINDKVLFMEDDCWYSPTYVERMSSMLNDNALVGQATTYIYNVASRGYLTKRHPDRSSLHATGMDSHLPLDLTSPKIDCALWMSPYAPRALHDDVLAVCTVGLPGTKGFMRWHKPGHPDLTDDANLDYLRALIGQDAGLYEKFYRP